MANPIKISSTVETIEQFGDGVYKVTLVPSKRLPRFKAGQFLHLTVDAYDPQGGWWPESRVFSIASHPTDEHVEIVYSVKGIYTNKMREYLEPGKEVWLKLPYGDFSVQSVLSDSQDVILVAGGTGVSPYIPFVKKEIAAFSQQNVKLIYGIRKVENLLFKEVFENAIRDSLKFTMDLFVEQTEIPKLVNGAAQFEGIIQLDHLYAVSKAYTKPIYFLSGPPKMINYFKAGLIERGIDSNHIKIDAWE
ncbi:MAG: FAD-dependent oxidoreductase [Fibrobacter sp.]|nr:FAD-dependent oxidoreductase [Fibrobacter sp.]